MLGDDVAAGVEQGLGRVLLQGRVVPGLGPDHADLGFGVGLAHAQGEGVDAADDLGDGEGGHVAQDVGLGHGPGHQPGEVAGLVHAAEVGSDVFGALEPGAVLEDHVRELPGDLDDRVHVAEAGGEDQVEAFAGHVAQHPLGVGALGHGLHVGGLDPGKLLELEVGLVVGVGPARVADGGDVDEADLEGLALSRGGFFCRGFGFLGLFLLPAAAEEQACGQRQQADNQKRFEP